MDPDTKIPINRTIELWTTEDERSPSDDPKIPSYLARECPEDDNIRACDMLTECREHFAILKKDVSRDIRFQQHMKYNLWIMFTFGLIMGSVMSASLVCLFNIFKHRSYLRRQRKIVRQSSRQSEETTFMTTEQPIRDSHSVAQAGRRSVNRSVHQPPKPSFLASLFQRRRTHRYPPRPSLIRRLSRSNLFTSTMRLATSTSAARAAERQNSRTNQNNRTDNYGERLLNSDSDLRVNVIDRDRNSFIYVEPQRDWRQFSVGFYPPSPNRLTAMDLNEGNRDGFIETVIRSETPPPNYTDCMIQVRK